MSTVKTNRKTYRRTRRFYRFIPSWGQPADNLLLTSNTSVLESVELGDSGPSWRLRKALGQSVTSSLTGLRYSQATSGGSYSQIGIKPGWIGTKVTCNGLWPAEVASVPPTGADSGAHAEAAAAYVADARSKLAAFQGATFFGEILGAVRMFTRPAKGLFEKTSALATKLKRVRRVYHVDRASYRKLLGQYWLQYQFGIKPLAADLVSAARALDLLYSSGGFMRSERCEGTAVKAGVLSNTPNQGVLNATYAVQDRAEFWESSVRFIGTVVARPAMNGFPFQEEFGMAGHDIVPTAWELIPWSFAVDYFSNIGDILSAASFAASSVGWTEIGIRNKRTLKLSAFRMSQQPDVVGPNRYFDVTVSGGAQEASTTRVFRSATSFPIPPLNFEIPGWESPKWLNLAALADQIAQSDPRKLSWL